MSTQINHSTSEDHSNNNVKVQYKNFKINNVEFEYNNVDDSFGHILNILLSLKQKTSTSSDNIGKTKPSKELIKIICIILKDTLPSNKILIVLTKISNKIIQLCEENSIPLLNMVHFIETFHFLQFERPIYPEEILSDFFQRFSVSESDYVIDNNFNIVIGNVPQKILRENEFDEILDKLLNPKTEKCDIVEEIIKLDPSAFLPSKGSKFSACNDLFSPIDTVIPANSNKLIKTNLAITWNNTDYYMQILSRSGNAYKKNLIVQAGVIDIDYRMGNIGVLLQNNSDVDIEIKRGMAIAQYAYFRIAKISSSEVNEFSFKLESNRDGGFGSTDKI